MTNQVWTPPENPNPGDIYEEAIKDRKNKRYELALAKHIWFHENSVKIDPAYIGVRLSYNLEGWSLLAEQYPQAKELLTKRAEEARELVLKSEDGYRNAFKDFEAINKFMNASQDTVDLFVCLDRENVEKAKRVFVLAFSDLLAAEKYNLLNKYVDLDGHLKNIEKMHKMTLRDSDEEDMKKELEEYAEQYLTYNIGAIIAILVNSDRKREAQSVVNQYANKLNCERYRNTLEDALKGTAPPKWP